MPKPTHSMFTINIKGKTNPKDRKLVKLEIIFFKTNYARVSKVLNISGPLDGWSNEAQSFKTSCRDATAKNNMLFDMKSRYQKVAEEWDYENRIWSPVELSHCFDEAKVQQIEVKALSVLQMIDNLIERFSTKEREKNGKIITSILNTYPYKDVKNSLSRFTQDKYGKAFSTFFFKDITDKFLLDYAQYLKQQGVKNGNKGGLVPRLRRLRAVCNYADKLNIYGVNMKAFQCLGDNMKYKSTVSKAVSHEVIKKLEAVDTSLLGGHSELHIDLFMFSYYAGGMANVDVCHLTWDSIKENHIVYERMKYPKTAKPLLVDHARRIIEKYRGTGYGNYIFPVFTANHQTDLQQAHRVQSLSQSVSSTLKKACKVLDINEKVTWYSARGSFISRMVDKGFSLPAVAEMAGNSPAVICAHYYKNTQGDEMLKQMNAMNGC